MIQLFRTICLATALLLVSTTIAEADSLQWKQMKVDIDIYMGKDVSAAREWGIQDNIQIRFANADNS